MKSASAGAPVRSDLIGRKARRRPVLPPSVKEVLLPPLSVKEVLLLLPQEVLHPLSVKQVLLPVLPLSVKEVLTSVKEGLSVKQVLPPQHCYLLLGEAHRQSIVKVPFHYDWQGIRGQIDV